MIKLTQCRAPCIFACAGTERVDWTVWQMTADMVSLKEYIVGRAEARLKRTWWTGRGFMCRWAVTRPRMSSGRQASGSCVCHGRLHASDQPGRLPGFAPLAHQPGTTDTLSPSASTTYSPPAHLAYCPQFSGCLLSSVRNPRVHENPPIFLWQPEWTAASMRPTYSCPHDQYFEPQSDDSER